MQHSLALSTDNWAFGADDTGIWRNDGEDYTNWQSLAGLPRSSRYNGRWAIADLDKAFAHLLAQRAPVKALVTGDDKLLVKVMLGNHEFVSIQRFGYESGSSGLYGARHAAQLRNWLYQNEWKLRTSVGGCGYYDLLPALTSLGQWGIQVPKAMLEYLKPLCMAGREFCIPGEHHNTVHYDVKSAYASCAATMPLPDPKTLGKMKPRTLGDARRIIRTRNGASMVTIKLPCDEYGILPIMTEYGLDWLCDGGEITGIWTTNEIAYAISLGAELKRCEWIIIGATEDYYLKDFALAAYDEKEAAKSVGDAVGGRFWKRLFNATLGRLAADGDVWTAHAVPYGKQVVPLPKGASGVLCHFPYHFWLKREIYPGNGNRLWTALVIAEQRTRLHGALTRSHALYGFTDSVICKQGDFSEPIGKSIGQWEKQAEGSAIIRNVGTYQVGDGIAHARGIEAASAAAAVLGEEITIERTRKWQLSTITRH